MNINYYYFLKLEEFSITYLLTLNHWQPVHEYNLKYCPESDQPPKSNSSLGQLGCEQPYYKHEVYEKRYKPKTFIIFDVEFLPLNYSNHDVFCNIYKFFSKYSFTIFIIHDSLLLKSYCYFYLYIFTFLRPNLILCISHHYYRKLFTAGSRTPITVGFRPRWSKSTVMGDHYLHR